MAAIPEVQRPRQSERHKRWPPQEYDAPSPAAARGAPAARHGEVPRGPPAISCGRVGPACCACGVLRLPLPPGTPAARGRSPYAQAALRCGRPERPPQQRRRVRVYPPHRPDEGLAIEMGRGGWAARMEDTNSSISHRMQWSCQSLLAAINRERKSPCSCDRPTPSLRCLPPPRLHVWRALGHAAHFTAAANGSLRHSRANSASAAPASPSGRRMRKTTQDRATSKR